MIGKKLFALLGLVAGSVVAAPSAATDSACSALWNEVCPILEPVHLLTPTRQMPQQIPNMTITVAEAYPDNNTFVSPAFTFPSSPNVTTGLPAL